MHSLAQPPLPVNKAPFTAAAGVLITAVPPSLHTIGCIGGFMRNDQTRCLRERVPCATHGCAFASAAVKEKCEDRTNTTLIAPAWVATKE